MITVDPRVVPSKRSSPMSTTIAESHRDLLDASVATRATVVPSRVDAVDPSGG